MTNTYAVILTFANGTFGRFSPLNYSRNVASFFSTNIKLIIAIDAYTLCIYSVLYSHDMQCCQCMVCVA